MDPCRPALRGYPPIMSISVPIAWDEHWNEHLSKHPSGQVNAPQLRLLKTLDSEMLRICPPILVMRLTS